MNRLLVSLLTVLIVGQASANVSSPECYTETVVPVVKAQVSVKPKPKRTIKRPQRLVGKAQAPRKTRPKEVQPAKPLVQGTRVVRTPIACPQKIVELFIPDRQPKVVRGTGYQSAFLWPIVDGPSGDSPRRTITPMPPRPIPPWILTPPDDPVRHVSIPGTLVLILLGLALIVVVRRSR